MARSFIDLSIYLENDVLSDPPAFAPRIDYVTHEDSPEQIAACAELLRDLPRPLLMFCRSGARSAKLYQAASLL